MTGQTRGYLGLDIGGTGVKAGFFDARGRMLGFGRKGLTPTVHADGRVETPVHKIWAAAKAAVREAVGRNGRNVLAMAISSQGQTFVSLDERDRPLHDAIIWYDNRAKREEARWRKVRVTEGVLGIASIPKILWLRNRFPARMKKARKYLLLPDYFALRLTGKAVTDRTTAGSAGGCVPGKPCYDSAMLARAGISENELAVIAGTGVPIGTLLPAAEEEWGLSRRTLLVNGTNDQLAGAIGAGNCGPGVISETSGTCLALITLCKRPPRKLMPGVWAGRFPVGGSHYLLGYTRTAGVVLDWFRREFCGNASFAQLGKEAAAVGAGSDGLAVLDDFMAGFEDRGNSGKRRALQSLVARHGRAKVYRSLLESLAVVLRDHIMNLESSGARARVIRAIGGGAKDEVWLQIKADVTGRRIEQPEVTEAAVLGAAMIAAAGRGDFKSVQKASKELYRARRVFTPKGRML